MFHTGESECVGQVLKVDLLWFGWFCSNTLWFMFLGPVKATWITFGYGCPVMLCFDFGKIERRNNTKYDFLRGDIMNHDDSHLD